MDANNNTNYKEIITGIMFQKYFYENNLHYFNGKLTKKKNIF